MGVVMSGAAADGRTSGAIWVSGSDVRRDGAGTFMKVYSDGLVLAAPECGVALPVQGHPRLPVPGEAVYSRSHVAQSFG